MDSPDPERDALRRALLAHFTGHLSISTTFRAHDGRLMASFTQDAMIRGFDDDAAASAIPAEARL
jgi:hypothetical protein